MTLRRRHRKAVRSYDRRRERPERRSKRWQRSRRTERHRPESGRTDRRRREGARSLLVVGAERDQPDRRSPGPRVGTSGTTTASATSTSPRSSSTSTSATSTRRSSQAIKDQADKLCTIGPPMANESRSRARPDARRGDARRPLRLVLHERRRRGQRERDQARAHGHRPPQDHRALPLLPRRHPRRRLADRRPAPLARRAGHGGHRARVRPVHLPLPGRPSRPVPGLHGRAAPRGDPRVRGRPHGRRDHPRDGHRHERHHRAARRLPAERARGLRPPRHPADPRRGDGRLRPHRQVVRLRALGRRARHPHASPRASTPATCRSAR